MSFNLHAVVERRELEREVMPMTLTRASRGITSTAYIAVGESISFDGLYGEVMQIVHDHVPGGDHSRAPNSHAYIEFGPLDEDEIDVLLRHGWELSNEGSDNENRNLIRQAQ